MVNEFRKENVNVVVEVKKKSMLKLNESKNTVITEKWKVE